MPKRGVPDFAEIAKMYLTSVENEASYPVYKSVITRFVSFYKNYQKPIESYTKRDFIIFLNRISGTSKTFVSNRTRLKNLFIAIGYSDLVDALRLISDSDFKSEKRYIKSFEELDVKIEETRFKIYPIPDSDLCDKFTMGQVIFYLAWLGVPSNLLPQMPLDSINLKKNFIDGGRKYSFADNPKMIEVFTKYKNATRFMTARIVSTVDGKPKYRTESYYGDGIIRVKKQKNCESADREMSVNGTISHLSANFPDIGNYTDIMKAGQFSRGYEKLRTRKQSPDFTSYEKLWDYFGAIVKTESQAASLQAEWNNYVAWREETD